MHSYIFSRLMYDGAFHVISTELFQCGLGENESFPWLQHNVKEVFSIRVGVWPRLLRSMEHRPRCPSLDSTHCLLLRLRTTQWVIIGQRGWVAPVITGDVNVSILVHSAAIKDIRKLLIPCDTRQTAADLRNSCINLILCQNQKTQVSYICWSDTITTITPTKELTKDSRSNSWEPVTLHKYKRYYGPGRHPLAYLLYKRPTVSPICP